MPVDPHNLATKPQLDIAFLIKAGMAQWQTADVSRDLERPLAQGGPTIWQVRFFAQDDDPASKAFLPQAFGSTGRSVAATDQQIGFIGEHASTLVFSLCDAAVTARNGGVSLSRPQARNPPPPQHKP